MEDKKHKICFIVYLVQHMTLKFFTMNKTCMKYGENESDQTSLFPAFKNFWGRVLQSSLGYLKLERKHFLTVVKWG